LEYLEVIRFEGGDSISYCNLAGCYERLGEIGEARNYYTKAAQMNPNLAESWFGIGITFQKETKYKEALQHFKRAVLLEPENAEFLLILAECEYQLGFIKEAEEVYAKLVDMDPGMMEAYLDWSFIKYSEGLYEQAEKIVRDGLKYDPECHQHHYRLVVYLYALGRSQEALLHLEKGLSIHFIDHFLVFDIAPPLRNVPEIMAVIDSHRDLKN
jgi:tetratricopeptide (TPR) repeat protein